MVGCFDLGVRFCGFGTVSEHGQHFFARIVFESQASVTRGQPANETGAARHGAEVTPAGSTRGRPVE